MLGERLHVGDLPAAGQPAVGVPAPVDALDEHEPAAAAEQAERVAGGDRVGAARAVERRERLDLALVEVAAQAAERGADLRPVGAGEQVDGLQRRQPSPPSIGCRQEGGEPRAPPRPGPSGSALRAARRRAARSPRGTRRTSRSSHASAAAADGATGASAAVARASAEQRRDDGRGERVRRHREQRHGVELQPGDRRGRNAAGGRDGEHARERPRQRVALEHAHRAAARAAKIARTAANESWKPGSNSVVRVPPEQDERTEQERIPPVPLARGQPGERAERARDSRRGSRTAAGRPRARTQPSRPAPRARPGAGAARRATRAQSAEAATSATFCPETASRW